jgi:hypothetical protein
MASLPGPDKRPAPQTAKGGALANLNPLSVTRGKSANVEPNLKRLRARFGHRVVLVSGTAADADGSHHFAVPL